MNDRMRHPGALVVLLLCGLHSGCASSHGPDFLAIDSQTYAEAFDAAVEAARVAGLSPTVQDRRSGLIETEPRIAGSVLEPWRTDNDSFTQTIENTITFQRRRARFEFAPVIFQPNQSPDAPLTGPDLFGTQEAVVDLTRHAGAIELRVWVYVERSYTPGLRRSTWTRAKTTKTRIVPAEDAEALRAQYWTTVHRDEAYERRLLAAVQSALAQQTETSSKMPVGETVAATEP